MKLLLLRLTLFCIIIHKYSEEMKGLTHPVTASYGIRNQEQDYLFRKYLILYQWILNFQWQLSDANHWTLRGPSAVNWTRDYRQVKHACWSLDNLETLYTRACASSVLVYYTEYSMYLSTYTIIFKQILFVSIPCFNIVSICC